MSAKNRLFICSCFTSRVSGVYINYKKDFVNHENRNLIINFKKINSNKKNIIN